MEKCEIISERDIVVIMPNTTRQFLRQARQPQQHQGIRVGPQRQGPARRIERLQDQTSGLLGDAESSQTDLHRGRIKVSLRRHSGRQH